MDTTAMKMDTITLNPTTSNPSLPGAALKKVPPVPNNETTNAMVSDAATLDDGVCLDVVLVYVSQQLLVFCSICHNHHSKIGQYHVP